MSQEQTQQLLYEMQMLESHITELNRRESSLEAVLREAIAATQSIKSLEGTTPVKSLVPLGLGAFARTEIYPNAKLIVNIGAGIAVEKEHGSAINYIESRIKEIDVAMQDTASRKHEAIERMEQGRQVISNMGKAAAKPSAKTNV
ncbi:MAG: prefoldin alpha subunit [Cenarchaeum symbiont of Oopsacas minuta]|nr:prefoldin alpha subunit [Cenarchaeum symbiont of Oopsacas minuta]